MVRIRNAIESTYDGRCTITEHQKITKANKSTGFEDVSVLENQPCRLSFSSINSTTAGEAAATKIQVTKVFLSPSIQVKAGSKLTITQNGVTTDYMNSGVPAVYDSHQEIIVNLFEGWA